MSTIYKLFSGILNKHIVNVADTNQLFAHEQNGFWKGRSCIDHIFVLSSIIGNRKAKGLSTYIVYIDFEKAFDRIDRKLLFHKLMSIGISGKILDCIKSIYEDGKAGVNVNRHITNWFSIDFGVKQGDTLSPIFFGLFINDFVNALQANTKGIDLETFGIHCLLYADDLVLIAESEEDLQKMLDVVHDCCEKWCMRVNVNKSKVTHFRTKNQAQTDFDFILGNKSLEKVNTYKYLGVTFDSSLNFETTAEVLAKSGGRALGAIFIRFRSNKGLGYKTYTKLFHTGITPILDYCSWVWGFLKLEQINTVQNRAIKYFLGTHRFSPNLAINDMGWSSSQTRWGGNGQTVE